MNPLKVIPAARTIAIGLVACAICALLGAVGGIWAGVEWQRGQQAQADNQVLRTDIDQLSTAARDLRQRGADIAQDFRTAHRRFEDITDAHRAATTESRAFYAHQTDQLAELVASNPHLRDGGCLGDGGLQHWNASARGASTGAAGAAAEHPPERASAVPGDAADTAPGQRRGDPADPSVDGRAVPGLPPRDERADRRRPGVRKRGLAQVLRRRREAWAVRAGLRGVA